MKLKTSKFKVSEDIMTKFKSQGLYIIRIKYWNASRSGFPPSLIPASGGNIGILHYKQAKLPKHLQHSVSIGTGFILSWLTSLIKFHKYKNFKSSIKGRFLLVDFHQYFIELFFVAISASRGSFYYWSSDLSFVVFFRYYSRQQMHSTWLPGGRP